ncbi:MAG: MFS transporter, partial [Chitinophaga rupis]
MKTENLFAYLFPLCSTVFLGYLTVGISLGVLPAYVHQQLHFNNLMVGIVIGLQSAATLATRHFSGRLADTRGSRPAVRAGIVLSAIAGVFYLFSYFLSGQAITSLVMLIAGRMLLGCGESLLITGALSWGIGLLGHERS